MNKPSWQFFVPGYIFKALGTLGMIQNFSANDPFPMNKLNSRFRIPCPLPFKRNINRLSIPNPIFLTASFFSNGRNSLQRAELLFRISRVDMGDFFKSQHVRSAPCYCNYGHNRWDNWPYHKFGIVFTNFLKRPVWIHTCVRWMTTWWDFSIRPLNIDSWMRFILWFWNGVSNIQTQFCQSTCPSEAILFSFPMLERSMGHLRRPRWYIHKISLPLYRPRFPVMIFKHLIWFGNKSEEQGLAPTSAPPFLI